MNEQMQFSETEKQALTLRLRQAAQAARRPSVRRLPRRAAVLCAAAVLTLAVAGAAAAGVLQGRFLSIEGQNIAADAVLTPHADGSATITVTGANGEVTTITAPPATASGLIDGTNGEFAVSYDSDEPYQLQERDGRLILRRRDCVPLDVTDLIGTGYTFSYKDKDGAVRTASVSGTPARYTAE
ncbi:MAG: hypothetical protein Q4C72_02950 [Eubacteriales bacterium]|nr:hypothetical protein [Eubacteriales bacterium]